MGPLAGHRERRGVGPGGGASPASFARPPSRARGGPSGSPMAASVQRPRAGR